MKKADTEMNASISDSKKTLKQMREEAERLLRETRYYYGLKELRLTAEDPLRMELFQSRLLAALVASREAARMVAASPLVREISELCCGLYTREGQCITQSIGMAGHVPVMGQIVDWMIRQNYEEEVGINEGDLFCCNENIIAGMHAADVCDLLPIFGEGELVAWAATTTMEAEIGAISPGTLPSANTERFTDGMRICAEKIGTNDLISKTFETRCRFGLRLPDLFLLDRRGAIAANIRLREEIKATIKEFGVNYFSQASRELIEGERRDQLARVRTLTVPGRYRNAMVIEQMHSHLPVPPIHARDEFVLLPLEFTIEPTGKYVLDFDGTGAWGWHPTNCTPSALLGAFSVVLVHTIAYSGRANTGTLLSIELNIPYDTMVWPSSPYIATSLLWGPATHVMGLFQVMQSRAFFSRGFREEVMAGAICGPGMEFGGKNQYGMEPFGFFFPEGVGTGGSGGCSVRDGIDSGFVMTISEPDMGSCEVWELALPMVWLGRKMQPDSGGHGKYRGGHSVSSTFILYKTPGVFLGITAGTMVYCLDNYGLYGGYPSPMPYFSYVKDPNLKELVAQRKPLVYEVGDPRDPDLKKRVQGKFWGPFGNHPRLSDDVLKDGDIIQVEAHSGCGGYGDPIERNLGLIKKDLDNGLLSLEICRKVYCVEASFDLKTEEYIVDEQKTRELREQKRRQRLQRGVPVEKWWHKSRRGIINGEFLPLLKNMYNDSLAKDKRSPQEFKPIWNTSGGYINCRAKGERWPQEFRAFWDLPDDFTF